MNDRQNTVVATTVAGLVLVVVFLCPWRVESSGEITVSPIYQPPISYVQTYDLDNGGTERSRLVSKEAEIAIDVLGLEVIAVLIVGGGLYMLTSDSSDEWESASD